MSTSHTNAPFPTSTLNILWRFLSLCRECIWRGWGGRGFPCLNKIAFSINPNQYFIPLVPPICHSGCPKSIPKAVPVGNRKQAVCSS